MPRTVDVSDGWKGLVFAVCVRSLRSLVRTFTRTHRPTRAMFIHALEFWTYTFRVKNIKSINDKILKCIPVGIGIFPWLILRHIL